MLTERRRALLVFNGIGLIATAVLSGWLYFFFTLGAIDLWPFVTDVPVAIPGDRRAWNMAHLEGITNGTMLVAIGAAGGYLRLGERARACWQRRCWRRRCGGRRVKRREKRGLDNALQARPQ